MRRLIQRAAFGLALVCLARVGPVRADDPAPDEKAGAQEIQEAQEEMQKELQSTSQELGAKYQKLQAEKADQKALQAVIDEFRGEQRKAAGKVFKVASKHAALAEAQNVFLMVLQLGGDDAAKAQELLIEHHVSQPSAGQMAFGLIQAADPNVLKVLAAIIEKNDERQCQGMATLALGMWHKGQIKAAEKEEAKAEHASKAKEAFAAVQEKYADVELRPEQTLGKLAAGQAAGIDNALALQVGKEIIDLEGEDTDGKKFKLSDYRGKVVLLDFWAFW